MENWFLDDQIVNILKVGLSGITFLIFLMSYFLLKSEQKREKEARENILKSIHRFTFISIFFVLIIGGFSVAELIVAPAKTKTNEVCQEKLNRMVRLSDSEHQTVESLRLLIKNSVSSCIEEDEINE